MFRLLAGALGRLLGGIALIGMLLSLLAHAASFAGWLVSEHMSAFFAMHVIAVLLAGAAGLRMVYGDVVGATPSPLAGHRRGVKVLAALITAYALLVLCWGIPAFQARVPDPGQEVVASRVFSAAWLFVFGFPALLFLRPRRRVP